MFLRSMIDATKPVRLAADNAIGCSTVYRYLDEALAVVAAQAPDLHAALVAAEDAGYGYVMIDGTLTATNRSRTIGPTQRGKPGGHPPCAGGWLGKHGHHGGNVQVVTAPNGWPIWTSPAHPGREHDATYARALRNLLDELETWSN